MTKLGLGCVMALILVGMAHGQDRVVDILAPVEGGFHGSTFGGVQARVHGEAHGPLTIRSVVADLQLSVSDWPHGPQLIDAAAFSSINVLDAATTPMSFYGVEVDVRRTGNTWSLPAGSGWVPGARAIRGGEITLSDERMPWEPPHDAGAFRGLGVYAQMPGPIGRRLGTGIEIGGSAGWEKSLHVVDTRGETVLIVDEQGILLRAGGRLLRLRVDPDGTVRAR